jgi:hypothetical protein
LLAGFRGWCPCGESDAEGRYGNYLGKPRCPPRRGSTRCRPCLWTGWCCSRKVFLMFVRFTLNLHSFHSPAGDGPGRAVFRR